MILFIADRNKYTAKRLVEEAAKDGLSMEVVDTADLVGRKFKVNVKKYDALFVRFFDRRYQNQIISLAKKFRRSGKKVIGNVLDNNLGKLKTYQVLEKNDLPIPKTYPFGQHYKLRFPMVVKTIHGLGAKEVFLASNKEGLGRIAKKFSADELLVQNLIAADFEYKVITVGYKSLPFVLKFPIDKKILRPDFKLCRVKKASNFSAVDRRAVRLAEKSSKLLKRELAKTDILSAGNKLYILEVNRWPGLGVPEKYSGYNIAGEFVRYIRQVSGFIEPVTRQP